MILGPSGAGKTTLGRRTAQRLGLAFLDIDEFIWRKDTPKPFTAMFSREERIARLQQAVSQAGRFVMAGSMDSFHQHFDPYFRLAVYLTAPAALRVERVHRRGHGGGPSPLFRGRGRLRAGHWQHHPAASPGVDRQPVL